MPKTWVTVYVNAVKIHLCGVYANTLERLHTIISRDYVLICGDFHLSRVSWVNGINGILYLGMAILIVHSNL